MTWNLKVQRIAFALVIVAGLALASGADYYGSWISSLQWNFLW